MHQLCPPSPYLQLIHSDLTAHIIYTPYLIYAQPYPSHSRTSPSLPHSVILETLNLNHSFLEEIHPKSIKALYHTSFIKTPTPFLALSIFLTSTKVPFTPHHETSQSISSLSYSTNTFSLSKHTSQSPLPNMVSREATQPQPY